MAGPSPPRRPDDGLTELSRRSGELEHITSAEQIVTLLNRVKQNNSQVTVTLPGSKEYYNSAILAIHPNDNSLVLDELTPANGNAQLLQAEKVCIHARLKGVDLSFATKPGTLGREGGIAFYRLPLPERMIYRQRRAAYRVTVGRGTAIPVALAKDGQGTPLQGQLLDISLSGLAIHCLMTFGPSARLALDLAEGAVLPYCSVTFPDDVRVSSELKVSYINRDLDRQTLRIGGSFVGLDRAQRRIIEQFVTNEDRRQKKDGDGHA